MEQFFIQGKAAIEEGRFEEAKKVYEQILQKNPTCVDAWNNLGVALCELYQFKKSVEAYSKIDEDLRTAKTWYNIALAHFFSSDFEKSLESIQKSLNEDSNNAAAFDLKGKIQIEQEKYQQAMVSFNQAFVVSGNPKYLLWEAYSLHLLAEFSQEIDESTHKRLLNLLIRKLERIERLASHANKKLVKEQSLYFLGCCYSRYKDSLTAVDRLGECLGQDTNPEIARAAKNLLTQIWNFQIRPPWWSWWLQSPSFLHRSIKQWIFGLTFTSLLLIITFLVFHPLIFMRYPQVKPLVDWSAYLFVIGLFLVILVSPSIEQIKTKDMEVKMHSPPPLDPFPSPARLEDHLGSLKDEQTIKSKQGILGLFEITNSDE